MAGCRHAHWPCRLPMRAALLPSYTPHVMRMQTSMWILIHQRSGDAASVHAWRAIGGRVLPLASADIRRHGGSRRFRSRSFPPRWPWHVDLDCVDLYMHNPMTYPIVPPFQYRVAYGCVPLHSAAATSTHTYLLLPSPPAHSRLPTAGNEQTGGVVAYRNP